MAKKCVFEYKSLNDPVHGSISLSEVECKIIETNVFRRLAGLRQLGLAYQVFPGATHTRFSHSIGALHVMSKMIDSINLRCRKDGVKVPIDDNDKQKLRLAAVLHDIGHYPLSHATEAVFFRFADESSTDIQAVDADTKGFYLHEMASVKKTESVTHERFGDAIVRRNAELSGILMSNGFDPTEIAKIFIGEWPKKPIFSQLIHSTLDADRIDFLLRDSHFAGVTYGHVDLDFLVSNLRYDRDEKLFAVDYKAITTFEHLLIARYYMYNNITYHKTVMALEFMAQTAYYEMARTSTNVIGRFEDMKSRINDDWIQCFDDDYFWTELRKWKPRKQFFKRLREDILARRPLILLYEERCLVKTNDGRSVDTNFKILRDDSIVANTRFKKLCGEMELRQNCFAIVTRKIKFEEQPPLTSHVDALSKEESARLGKVYEGHEFKDLLQVKWAIIPQLSKYVQYIRRLYYYDIDKRMNNPKKEEFRRKIESALG